MQDGKLLVTAENEISELPDQPENHWGFLFALKGKTCNLCHCRAEAMVLKSVELYYGKIWMCHMTVRPSVPNKTGKNIFQ